MMRYPMQIAAYKKEVKGIKQTFAITDNLANSLDTENPLEAPNYSRYVLSILRIEGTKKEYVMANFPEKEVSALKTKVDAIYNAKVMKDIMGIKSESGSIPKCYTETFAMGNYKGKTPAQILIDNPAEKDNLEKQKTFLASNLAKFPANQAKIDAIDEAINLLATGKLNADVNTSKSCITVVEPVMKPLVSKQKEGKTFVYTIEIVCSLDNKYPWEIKITNFYAPVVKNETGTLNVQAREAVDKKVLCYRLTDDDFISLVNQMDENIKLFKMSCTPDDLKKAMATTEKVLNLVEELKNETVDCKKKALAHSIASNISSIAYDCKTSYQKARITAMKENGKNIADSKK